MAVFWVAAPCSLVDVTRRFRGTCCLQQQGNRETFTRLHGATIQKAAIFKNPVRTSKKTQCVSITKINYLILFKEIIPVYSENHTKPIVGKRHPYWMLNRWHIQWSLHFKVLKHIQITLSCPSVNIRYNTYTNFYNWFQVRATIQINIATRQFQNYDVQYVNEKI
jgi:hypothetical protein